MNIKKFMSKTAIVAVSVGLAAVSAHAAKPNNPPKDSGRPVIEEAQGKCGISPEYQVGPALGDYPTNPEIRAAACDLLFKTDGDRIEGKGCSADSTTNEYVTYSLRNCEKNEAALQRKAASVVLSMDDIIERGKLEQTLAAAIAACEYASKADFLSDVGKLTYLSDDLARDADSIVVALEYSSCEELLD